MSHHNPNIPGDYNPAPDGLKAPTFSAPAHNFNSQQAEQIVELAESSHRDTGSGMSGGYGGSSTGYGSSGNNTGYSSSSTGGAGYGDSNTTRGSEYGSSTGGAGYGSGNTTGYPGDGTGQGVYNTGSTTQELPRQTGDYQLGRNDDNRIGSNAEYGNTGSSRGLGGREAAGMGAAGAGLGAAGMSSNRGGMSGETPTESSGNRTSGGGLNTTSNSGSGPVASSGTLEHSLQSELERNARKKGTHAAGFGTAGMSSDTGALNHESSGISKTGAAGGYSSGSNTGGMGSGMQQGYGGQGQFGSNYEQGYQQGLSTGQQGYSGQQGLSSGQGYEQGLSTGQQGYTQDGYGAQGGRGQGLENRLVGEVENRAHGSGSNNVTGLGSSGINSQQHGNSSYGAGRAL